MDLRVLVLTRDPDLGLLLQHQAENLGCSCNVRESYDNAAGDLDWAEVAIIDLSGEGLNDLHRARVETPRVRILAIASDVAIGDQARQAGAESVLVEPLSLVDLLTALRALQPPTEEQVIDLRTGAASPAAAGDEAPWWATR